MTRPLQGALVGFGFIAEKGHVPAYLSSPDAFEIVAVAEICAARREKAKQVLPKARIYPDTKTLLAAEAKNLDFVDIATPPCDHAAIAHAAFEHGLHVFCEKPIATSGADAKLMLDHAERSKRVFFPSHNYKHAPVIKAIRKVLESEELGAIHLVTLDTFRTTHAKGVAEWQPDWRRVRKTSGGGIAMDHGSHSFYLTFEWLGSYPTSLTARMSNLDPGRYDTEDEFAAVLKFPMGTADVHLTWTASVRKMIYTIRGEKGVLTMEDDHLQIETANGGNGHGSAGAAFEDKVIPSQWTDASHASWFNPVFEEFRGAIATRDFAGKDAQEAVLCVELINTAYRSARAQSRELPLGWVPELGATMRLD